jgi:hypothetical protein
MVALESSLPAHGAPGLIEVKCAAVTAAYARGKAITPRKAMNADRQLAPDPYSPPAGFVRLSGPFLQEHRKELLKRVRRCEESERRGHPMQRIMAIARHEGELLVTTSHARLARRIGEALHDAYQGELSYCSGQGELLLRVWWSR